MNLSSHVWPCRCSTFRSSCGKNAPTKTIIPMTMRMTLYSAISEPGTTQYLISPAIFYRGLKIQHKSITPRKRQGQELSDCNKFCALCHRESQLKTWEVLQDNLDTSTHGEIQSMKILAADHPKITRKTKNRDVRSLRQGVSVML